MSCFYLHAQIPQNQKLERNPRSAFRSDRHEYDSRSICLGVFMNHLSYIISILATTACVLAFSGCSGDGSNCESGECCDENGNYKAFGTICGEVAEYQCLETCGGINRQYRIITKICSGSSATCEEESYNPDWIPLSDCDDDEACALDDYGIAQCVECGMNSNCVKGSCVCDEGYEVIDGTCQNLCEPNPCFENFKTVCSMSNGVFYCSCIEGYELVDEECQKICDPACGDYSVCLDGVCVCEFLGCPDICCSDREICGLDSTCEPETRIQNSRQFGTSVSIDSDILIVGAPDYFSNGTPGAAYIYRFENEEWTEQQKLTSSDGEMKDRFGIAVSINGTSAIVGAFYEDGELGDPADLNDGPGAAYIFQQENGSWSEKIKLTASDAGLGDLFGISVSINGNTAIVGAPGNDGSSGVSVAAIGAAYIFQLKDGNWFEKQRLTASDKQNVDKFGRSVSISGQRAIVGAPLEDGLGDDIGAAYIFELVDDVWIETQKLTPPDGRNGDNFGFSVSIDGDTVIIGSPTKDWPSEDAVSTGAAYIYQFENGQWIPKQKIISSDAQSQDAFGWSVCIQGEAAIIGAPWEDSDIGDPGNCCDGPGAAYVFQLVDGVWEEKQKLSFLNAEESDEFGGSVSIASEAAIVGNQNKRAIYIF